MKTRAWVILLLVVLVLLLILPTILYRLKPDHRLEIVLLDKTVPFDNFIEHRSLFWLLDHLKIRHRDGRAYDTTRDYLGAYPGTRPGDPPRHTADLTAADVAQAKLVYLVDTYGVYRGDLESKEKREAALERSPKIYGGLTAAEVNAASRALQQGKTVVAEFNTLASPTGALARQQMESLLGVRWTRWVGRYFPQLEDEASVPQWLRRNWERESSRRWEFEGAGYVLLQDDAHCEVLRVGPESATIGLTIDRRRPVDTLLADARDEVPYPYWFDIVQVAPDTHVLAEFNWHLTDDGEKRLAARGLPVSFPAVVRREHGPAVSYYFAGDFSDNPMRDGKVPLAGYMGVRSWLEANKLAPSKESFFWCFYVPLMRELLARAGGF